MSGEISCVEAFRFGNGRRLMVVTKPGSIDAMSKDGPVQSPYGAGEILIADQHGRTICGPVGVAGAASLAWRIISQDERAICDPLSIFVLAAAVAAWVGVDPSEESVAKEAAV